LEVGARKDDEESPRETGKSKLLDACSPRKEKSKKRYVKYS
jgi:hypothetical protein